MADGEKEAMHRHDWIVRVTVSAKELDEQGFAADFVELKALLDKVVEPFGNRCLDEMPCFQGINASAENVTKYIYDRIAPALATRTNLEYVELMEAAGCWTKYSK